jgi:hypothetical protein
LGWLVALGVVLTACGGGGGGSLSSDSTTTGPASTSPPSTAASGAQQLQVAVAPWQLPAPTSRMVLLTDGKSLVLLGGQDARHVSTANGYVLDAATGKATSIGPLSPAVHDAAGIRLGNSNLVIAGGTPPARATVQAITSGQPTRTVGQLAAPRTDHVAAIAGGTIYVLGGADASEAPIASVEASTDGASWRAAGSLSQAVRYPAVAAFNGAIYLFGGVGNGHADTTAVQRYDPSTGTTTVVAQLSAPLSHAVAVVLANEIWVLGGFVSNTPTTQILRFDPRTNQLTAVGSLPAPVTDAAVVATGPGTAYFVGGEGPGRATTAAVVALTAR